MAEVSKQWYVINSYTGHENTVKDNLIRRIETMNVQNNIFRVIVAEEEVPVLKDGMPTGKTKIKNTYPGYVFVEMIMSDEAWFVVRNTPGVTGFVGSSGKGAKPFPLTKQEVDKILGNMGMSRIDVVNEINEGDTVKVISGAFANMFGKVKMLDMVNQKIEVALDLFGQETIVEVLFTEIEKA